jgi:hypothetical protein
MAPTTLRFHYVDLDALCGDILRIHLRKIADAIGNVPRGAENRRQLQRAAYLAATRSASSSLTNAHLILTRDRAFLPSDELDSIENIRRVLGESLVEPGNPDILPVLDTPWIGPDQIEAALTLLAPAIGKPAAAAKPESPPLTAVEPAEPPARPFIRFNIQDIPLPLPGSLAAMTDEELDAADNEAAAPPPNVLISPGPKHSPAEASAP